MTATRTSLCWWHNTPTPSSLVVMNTKTASTTLIIKVVAALVGIIVISANIPVGHAIPYNRLNNRVDFCEEIEGVKVFNISKSNPSATPFGFCIPDCEDNEICAELHMPIFPNGSTPLSAGTIGNKCLNYPAYLEGVCILKTLIVQPVAALSSTTFLKSDHTTMLDLSMHCFDAPPGTTAVSTKCGAGKISRSLCRGFASISYYAPPYPYLTGLSKQCGIDIAALLRSSEAAPCACGPPFEIGVPMLNSAIHTALLDHDVDTFYGALLPNHICLPSPEYVDTDNGCPGGHTWQLNTAPLGYYCAHKTANGDTTLRQRFRVSRQSRFTC